MNPTSQAVLAARRARRILAPLGAAMPADVQAGYVAQHALAEAIGALPPAGFKIGATTRQMQVLLGLSGPAAGFVPAEGLVANGAAVPFARYLRPGVECEIGVRLGIDLPAGPCTAEAAAACVAGVFAAIEIVENRYENLAALGTPTLVADQMFHAGGVPGTAPADWRTFDLTALRGRMYVDGTLRGEGVGGDLLGHPMNALAWLAASPAAAVFGGLRAGQLVFLGSVTPPIWIDAPAEILVAFDRLGEVRLRFT
jgi:2-keto-4-pentenoate hydratase